MILDGSYITATRKTEDTSMEPENNKTRDFTDKVLALPDVYRGDVEEGDENDYVIYSVMTEDTAPRDMSPFDQGTLFFSIGMPGTPDTNTHLLISE